MLYYFFFPTFEHLKAHTHLFLCRQQVYVWDSVGEDSLCSAGCVWIYGLLPPGTPERTGFADLGPAARKQHQVTFMYSKW